MAVSKGTVDLPWDVHRGAVPLGTDGNGILTVRDAVALNEASYDGLEWQGQPIATRDVAPVSRGARIRMQCIRCVAAYEVLAGLLGFWRALNPQLYGATASVTFNLIAVALCSLSIVFGVRLWNSPARSRKESFVFQACQVPRLFAGHLQIAILIGIDVSVRFSGPLVSLWTTTGVSLVLGQGVNDRPLMIGVNLIATSMIVLLFIARDRQTNNLDQQALR